MYPIKMYPFKYDYIVCRNTVLSIVQEKHLVAILSNKIIRNTKNNILDTV